MHTCSPFCTLSLATAVICIAVKAAPHEIACSFSLTTLKAGSCQAALQNAPQLTCREEEDNMGCRTQTGAFLTPVNH